MLTPRQRKRDRQKTNEELKAQTTKLSTYARRRKRKAAERPKGAK